MSRAGESTTRNERRLDASEADCDSILERNAVKRRTEDPEPILSNGRSPLLRVAGVLSVTRALGDAFLKQPTRFRVPRQSWSPPYITACPQVMRWYLGPPSRTGGEGTVQRYLLLMSDGVHNWATDAELARWLQDAPEGSNMARVVLVRIIDTKVLSQAKISRAQLEERASRRSLMDDMTLVVVPL